MVGLIKNIDPDVEDPMAENPYMHIISRKDWGAHPPMKELPQIDLPINHIRFTHTGTESCKDHEECKKILKQIQYEQMDTLGHPDITYNFMIGAEGYVYEGRGWTTEPDRPSLHRDLELSSLEIAYIGEYEETGPSAPLLRAAFEMIVYAVRTRKLHFFFEGVHLT